MMQKNRLGNQKPTFDQYKNGDIWIAEKTIELLGRYYEPLLDWQRMVLRRWLAVDEDGKWSNPECVLTVPRQNGKEITLDTLLPTPTGYKKAGDVVVGDELFDRQGKPTEVQAVYRNTGNNKYKVTLEDGRSYECCDEHITPYLTDHDIKKGNPIRSKPLAEMLDDYRSSFTDPRYPGKVYYRYKYRIPNNEAVEYKSKQLPVDPYVLGVAIGDGCLTSSTGLIISSDDSFVVQKVADIIGTTYKRSSHNYNNLFKDTVQLKKLIQQLVGDYSYNKTIPADYLLVSKEQRLALLQGLMDTDGSCHKQEWKGKFTRQLVYSTSSEKLAETFRELCNSLGIMTTLASDERGDRVNYLIHLRTDRTDIFTLPRQVDNVQTSQWTSNKHKSVAIVDIEYLGTKDGVCFTVDNPESLYLITKGYIPTHNTFLIEARIIGGIVFRGEALMYTAQSLKTTDEIKRRVMNFFYNADKELNEMLTDEFKNKPKSLDYIELRNGGRCIFNTRTRTTGLGGTADTLLFDEAAELTDAQQEAMIPTLAAGKSQNHQTIYASMPPTSGSSGTVLSRIRRKVVDGKAPDVCMQEWGVKSITDVNDKDAWYLSNPSLGYFLMESAVAREAQTMSLDSFNSQRLGWWAGVESQRAISDEQWQKLLDKEFKKTPDMTPAYAVKFSPDRSGVSLAVGVLRNDMKVHVEVLERKSLSEGTAWLTAWLLKRWRDCGIIIIDGMAGTQLLVEDLVRTEPKTSRIILTPNFKQAGSAYGGFYQAIEQETITHFGQPLVEAGVKTIRKRDMRDGAFGFASMNSDIGSDIIESLAFAHYGALNPKRRKSAGGGQKFLI